MGSGGDFRSPISTRACECPCAAPRQLTVLLPPPHCASLPFREPGLAASNAQGHVPIGGGGNRTDWGSGPSRGDGDPPAPGRRHTYEHPTWGPRWPLTVTTRADLRRSKPAELPVRVPERTPRPFVEPRPPAWSSADGAPSPLLAIRASIPRRTRVRRGKGNTGSTRGDEGKGHGQRRINIPVFRPPPPIP